MSWSASTDELGSALAPVKRIRCRVKSSAGKSLTVRMLRIVCEEQPAALPVRKKLSLLGVATKAGADDGDHLLGWAV